MMRIADVVRSLEQAAPPAYAESWDNVGLLIGDAEATCRKTLLCIDLAQSVLEEARRLKAQLVMAYHPVIFKPVPRLTAEATPVAWAAARAGLAVYSVHTAWDAAAGGANDVLADACGMAAERRPLVPRGEPGQCQVVVFVPPDEVQAVSAAAFAAGAGRIGHYRECGFAAPGEGTFFGTAAATPAVGRPGRRERVPEVRWEAICPRRALPDVLAAIVSAHSYEEPAISVYPLAELPGDVGLGRVGPLAEPAPLAKVLERVRRACGVRHVQLAGPTRRAVRTLAVTCGSAGGVFRDAIRAGADLYVTGELRHHDALAAAAAGLTVACVGHSNSERLTLPALERRLRADLPKLAVTLSQADRDPFVIA